ncbi:MAG: acetyl-CoA carboxylase biotin carboxyl carrier protein subunit [Bacteroidales bacterium]|nr:acetyl-CoA carboxylase biotin carboxyl carrier protein subunit [Bacteroidales bacterium]
MKNYSFRINGRPYEVSIDSINGGEAAVTVNGVAYSVQIDNAPAAEAELASSTAAPTPAAQPKASPAPAAAPAGEARAVKSPLPGVIISIDVKEGQTLAKGQKVAVLEAMKMENEIVCEEAGTVSAVLVQKGDSVLEGAEIIRIV